MNSRSSWLLRPRKLTRFTKTNHFTGVCLQKNAQRICNYTTAMKMIENIVEDSPPPDTTNKINRKTRRDRQPKPRPWRVIASVLLSRPPLILPKLHPFEEQVQKYQEMIEQHQYTRFPLNFFFKQGSIAEKRWKQQHSREAKKSGSGILRPFPDEKDKPEWILGGISDEQVTKARENAPKALTINDESNKQDEELTDDEKRDLEQFAAEEEVDDALTEVAAEVDSDLHRLERKPQQTLYCLVKRSIGYNEHLGKRKQEWELISVGAPGRNLANELQGLHTAANRAIERHLGPRVQTWVVGTNPAAYITYPHEVPVIVGRRRCLSTREFVMKAYIFAGAVGQKRKFCSDHVWVTRDEMREMLNPRAMKAIKPLLADR